VKIIVFNHELARLGFGKIGHGDKTADILQKAVVPYVNHEDCVRQFKGITIYPTFLCAGGHNKTDTCRGSFLMIFINRKEKLIND
jgi:hypothetical protein